MSDCHSSARCEKSQLFARRVTVHNIHEVQGSRYMFGFIKNANGSRTGVRRYHSDPFWEEYQGSGLVSSPSIAEAEVNQTVLALLCELPEGYPTGTFTKNAEGYMLEIDRTIIFQRATGEDAIRHTRNYVDARKDSPNLPVGVIYGIYD